MVCLGNICTNTLHKGDDDDDGDNNNNYHYYYCCYHHHHHHHHHHHRISHFSTLAGKYSPILGFSNQQDSARWSYSLESFLQLKMCEESQIFASVYMFSDASYIILDFVIGTLELLL
jgi:hypothetical protein